MGIWFINLTVAIWSAFPCKSRCSLLTTTGHQE
jgi:hypothetical protein